MGGPARLARLRRLGRWRRPRPRPLPAVLDRRCIYVLPTGRGLGFAGLLALMLVGAINYDNSLGYALTFLLGSIGLLGIVHTWRNLHGLRIELGPLTPVFAGDSVRVPVLLDNRGAGARPGVEVQLDGGPEAREDIPADAWGRIELAQRCPARGRHPLGTLRVASRFPLGLFRAWAVVPLPASCLAYPRPAPLPVAVPRHYTASAEGDRGVGADDFAGLRAYQAGDSPRRINWKSAARERGLTTKLFGGDRSERVLIAWRDFAPLAAEARLSAMARAVLDAEAAGDEYGLELPGTVCPPGRGTAHRARCLEALAVFEEGP